ncbi:MAG TPA: hypothetical protein VE221_03900, partial [Sphingomicrobium sp.]|nr:hypothetical protein [Sphingomicrobium sp.]
MPLLSLELSPFEVLTCPAPAELGRALESKARVGKPVLQLRFGEMAAGLPISDVWSACCELLLTAQLVREKRLNRFVLDAEHVFDVSCAGSVVLCRFSPEHVFAVSREDFASALEQVVEQIFSGTSCPRLMQVAACWGASAIR